MPREHARGGFLVTVEPLVSGMRFPAPDSGDPKEKWELISSEVVVVPEEDGVSRELVCVWQKVFYAV